MHLLPTLTFPADFYFPHLIGPHLLPSQSHPVHCGKIIWIVLTAWKESQLGAVGGSSMLLGCHSNMSRAYRIKSLKWPWEFSANDPPNNLMKKNPVRRTDPHSYIHSYPKETQSVHFPWCPWVQWHTIFSKRNATSKKFFWRRVWMISFLFSTWVRNVYTANWSNIKYLLNDVDIVVICNTH